MTKADIITRICEKAHVSKDDVTNAVEGMFEIIKVSLERGEKVKIKNFGSFAVRTKRERRGRNWVWAPSPAAPADKLKR